MCCGRKFQSVQSWGGATCQLAVRIRVTGRRIAHKVGDGLGADDIDDGNGDLYGQDDQ